MSKKFQHYLMMVLSILVLSTSVPMITYSHRVAAHDDGETSTSNSGEGSDSSVSSSSENETENENEAETETETENEVHTTAEGQNRGEGKLEAAKLRVCENREENIKNIMARLTDRGQKQLDLFSTIADRTEKFYLDKGKTLSNYEALVGDVTAKKAAAKAKVDEIAAASESFSCDADNPKESLKTFRTELKAEISALKAYKTAVKNLIVGVKSAQGTTSSDKEGSNE